MLTHLSPPTIRHLGLALSAQDIPSHPNNTTAKWERRVVLSRIGIDIDAHGSRGMHPRSE